MSFKPEHLTHLSRMQEVINKIVDEMGVPKTEKESDALAKRLHDELESLDNQWNESTLTNTLASKWRDVGKTVGTMSDCKHIMIHVAPDGSKTCMDCGQKFKFSEI